MRADGRHDIINTVEFFLMQMDIIFTQIGLICSHAVQ
jgi:hypothetical protein